MSQDLFERMAQAVIEGEPDEAQALARTAVAEGVDPLAAINRGYTAGMNHLGQAFGKGECYLPDLLAGAEAMKRALKILEPELVNRGEKRETRGRVVIGTVAGDIHEIGKSLVGILLTANGFEVHDLGVNVKPETFVSKVRELNANVLCLSALLTTTMVGQRQVIESLKQAGVRDRVKVLVGGAPVTPKWATDIGADGYAENAQGAVDAVTRLLS
ncbi:MAG: corrinoid protein [Anaerolineae bacterium]